MLVKILQVEGSLKAQDSKGNVIPFNTPGKDYPTIWKNTAQKAFDDDMSFVLKDRVGKGPQWEKVSNKTMDRMISDENAPVDVPAEQVELMQFIQKSPELRPEVMKMTDIKWKYLMRCAMRGKNIMMTGPAGCGKTMARSRL